MENKRTVAGDIADMARMARLISKVMSDPIKAIDDILKDLNTAEGQKVVSDLKKTLCKRYHSSSIKTSFGIDTLTATLYLNDEIKTEDDVDVVYADVVKDMKEILAIIDRTGVGRVDIKSASKKLRVMYVSKDNTITVDIPLTSEIVDRIKRR